MGLGRLLSRRSILALAAAALTFGAAAMPKAQAAGRKAPNVLGPWVFILNSTQVQNYEVQLSVEKQSKKNGKISGHGASVDGSFTFKGKIKPNGKCSASFALSPQVSVQLDITVAADGNTADGTFTVTGPGGATLDNGTVAGEKNPV